MNHTLLIAGAAVAVLGLFSLISGTRRRAREAAHHAREAVHAVSLTGRVLVTACAITGTEYAVIHYAHNVTLVLVVLAVPALVAAIPLVRAVTMTGVTGDRRRVRR